jgi:MFS family permease
VPLTSTARPEPAPSETPPAAPGSQEPAGQDSGRYESRRQSPSLRRDLLVTTADAAAYSLMVGFGETYLPAFALAVGLGPVAAGMVATVPVLVGAIMQLITPAAVARMGTNRGWVVTCTTVQALSFVPFVLWALRGSAGLVELLIAASIYWAAGMAGAPAWNSWLATIVPPRIRTRLFAQRNRFGQFGTCIGFVAGGLLLRFAEHRQKALLAFAVIFALAALARLVSTALLAACSEPEPTAGRDVDTARGHQPLVTQLTATVRGMARRPSGRLVAFLCTFVFGAQISAPYFIPYMLRERGFSYLAFTIVIAASFLAKALALPALGRLASRVGSVRLLWIAGLSITPLALLWLPSDNVPYLVGVQVIAGTCWAAYELAVALLLFEAVGNQERTGVVTVYNLGLAVAMVAGAACGGALLQWWGETSTAYAAVFIVSSLLRLASLPLLRHVRTTAS